MYFGDRELKKYTYEEALEASKLYFNGDELAAKVFVDKYALQNNEGEYLELMPSDMHRRLAKEFARIELKYSNPMSEDEIYSLFDNFKYVIPQGSPMSGIGNPYQVQSLGNCFVIDSPLDSYGGILKADQELVQLAKRRAGIGFNISNIRPKGMATKNAAKTTDGIGVFMERFSSSCREVAQSGRRGALLLAISVHHPEVETFINIKRNKTKVTGANISVQLTDEFMQAVKDDTEYEQKFPIDSDNPIISKKVKARLIWDQIIDNSHLFAEPGILYWSNQLKNSPADIYAKVDKSWQSSCTNPCFSGDTKIAVADGRNSISIKQLAEEGKDVPVYSLDKHGKVSIKWGRNPRITGYDKKLVRVYLDDQSYLDVTPDHKFILLNGSKVEAKNLKCGDSLPRFTKHLEPVKKNSKDYYRIYGNVLDDSKDKIFEHRLIAKFYYPEKWSEVYDYAKNSGFANTGGLVVHHKDYNSLNNSPNNLEIMTFKQHSKFHASIDTVGEKNGRYSGFTSEQIIEHALYLTKYLGRRFSTEEWEVYAKENKLPMAFSSFRKDTLGSVSNLAKVCATILNMEYVDSDPRIVKTYQNCLLQGYDARVENNVVYVKRICEECNQKFEIDYYRREQAFCSVQCAVNHSAADPNIKNSQQLGIYKYNNERSNGVRQNQARIYSQLKFQLVREPLMKEWENECSVQNIPYRVGKSLKFSFKSFKEVKEAGNNYNHKVLKIEELNEKQTVYNITVDDNHTVGIITSEHEKRGNTWYSGIYTFQCGEIGMGTDSCRLLVINLYSFVQNSFTNKAKFDYTLYGEVVQKAQRLMDDIVDLELESIDKIIKKIKSDPEPDDVKQTELNMWKKFRKNCSDGRRTGLGITALGDVLAALNIRYGSDESIKITEKIYKNLAINAYKSTCTMAGERGAFPIFSHVLEKGHEFLDRILNSDQELKKLYEKFGRRNIALTTTAPTGSVSILTQTSSGIEPVFLVKYDRFRKVNKDVVGVENVDRTDAMGDSWQKSTVYHHKFKDWMNISGKTKIEESPYYKSTSNDIDWRAGVKLQGVAQKWICHSISRTTNIPNNSPKELVADIYMSAWEHGCKGFTVYRDGCRDGVLVSTDESKESTRPQSISQANAPKRPNELKCEIHQATVKGQKWTVLVGLLNNEPYEVFMGHSEMLHLPTKCSTGKIIKQSKGHYNLHVDIGEEELIIKDIIKVFDNPESAWATRMLSLSMRHGVPIEFIVDQLSRDGAMGDVNKVISRILKKYIIEGSKVRTSSQCPVCSSVDLIYQEGCISCKCGFSKCN